MKTLNLKYCLCTEATDKTFPYLRVMLRSFVENNIWFNGEIVILINSLTPFSKDNQNIISSLHENVVFKHITDKLYRNIVSNSTNKNRFNTVNYIHTLYALEAMSLKEYNFVLYINHLSLITGDMSKLFSSDADLVSTIDSYNFPISVSHPRKTDKQYPINTGIMLISHNILKSNIANNIKLRLGTTKSITPSTRSNIITDFIVKSEFKLKLFSNTLYAKKSSFPDSKSRIFDKHKNDILGIDLDIGIFYKIQNISRLRFKRIDTEWVKYNKDVIEPYDKDISVNESILTDYLTSVKRRGERKSTTQIPRANAKHYRTKVSNKFIDNNITTEGVIEIIKGKIKDKEPFCITRFGDGDLNIIRPRYSKKWILRGIQKQGISGATFTEKHNKLKAVTMKGINESDIIGIMSLDTINRFRFKPQNWTLTKNEAKTIGVDIQDRIICDHQFAHSRIFGEISSFKKIIDGKPIHIISHHKDYLIENNLDKLLSTSITYTKSPAKFYSNREKLISTFSSIKEDIVLFSCSGGGKDIGVILRDEYGKIAIDMGSVIDAWAGVVSRIRFQRGHEYEYLVIGPPKFNANYSLAKPGDRIPKDS